jgi:hypothetical protein
VIHVLVVGPLSGEPGRLPESSSSVEVLHAHGPEDAVEKLARNRRIDAVLLLEADNASVARAIREDVLSPPPLFAPAGSEALEGVRPLEGVGDVLLFRLSEALNAGRGEDTR